MAIEWEHTKTTTEAREIGKCTTCKKVASRLVVVTTSKTFRSDRISAVGSSTVRVPSGPSACACGGLVYYMAVAGIKTAKKCDARCMSSKGHNCECSCGGLNHGASHGPS